MQEQESKESQEGRAYKRCRARTVDAAGHDLRLAQQLVTVLLTHL
jgi:hypothetical protein